MYRANNLVVSRATAKVAGQAISNFSFCRIWVLLKQRLRGYQKPGSADTALQRGSF
ncbi:uncharacterized protein METZ01_LOCUS26298 [marine metagenome]|uniref:Uncharacterized protein n=1 Tax=marine metagenome TaxID=408172 RepID=A0A381Q3H9_9ZZZZ